MLILLAGIVSVLLLIVLLMALSHVFTLGYNKGIEVERANAKAAGATDILTKIMGGLKNQPPTAKREGFTQRAGSVRQENRASMKQAGPAPVQNYSQDTTEPTAAAAIAAAKLAPEDGTSASPCTEKCTPENCPAECAAAGCPEECYADKAPTVPAEGSTFPTEERTQ